MVAEPTLRIVARITGLAMRGVTVAAYFNHGMLKEWV
jgi:hypothetical protein